ncbi:B3/4 domain-containing protein [Clostridium sp.]|uniref:B3/B4 domain-containing protein n=1 Tax=Clostridium sp. TaxID=1506 RepID=UPI001A5E74FF|nr:B3/4 domain-containing protein [Clostridium sp.]MBK5242660.1 B3/4 domain-containing protein [Clostridium sp.]
MKKFIVEDDFWGLFPQARIGVVVCTGIDNAIRDEDKFKELVSQAEIAALTYLTEEQFSKNPVIQIWREAFKKFKTKKGVRSSIEALLKRVDNGNRIGNINPLVDIYNSISLNFALPCGGEDIDKFVGNIRLTKADGNEEFITLGSDESSSPYEGELIYKDDDGAICRCLNWRESVRTMLTESTKDAFMCVELLDETRYREFEQSLKQLADLINKNLGGTTEIIILSNQVRECYID